MPMPPNRNARPSSSREIPDNLIVNWRMSDAFDLTKPLTRRPITACDTCRTAKVKCNGQQDCRRCTARGLICTYAFQPATNRCSPTEGDAAHPSSLHVALPTTVLAQDVPHVPREMPASTHNNTLVSTPDPLNHTAYQPEIDLRMKTTSDWANGLQHQSIDRLDWGPVNPKMNEQTFGPVMQSAAFGLDLSQCLREVAHQTFPQNDYTPPFHNNSHSESPSSVSGSLPLLGLPNNQAPPNGCLCRASLMLCLPKVTSAMEEKRLDKVLKVTGELTQCCQDIIDCKIYRVSCTDLLLIMAVLQEIHPCFDYIAKSDLEGAVKVSFGGYEVSLNDASLRAMIVMDLAQRASTVLTSISTKGQDMIDKLSELSCLAQANIAYLEATISHFRTILQCTTEYIEDAVEKDRTVFRSQLSAPSSQSPLDQ